MEMSLRRGQSTGIRVGIVSVLALARQRMVEIFSKDTLPIEMLKVGLSYEASKTFRTIKSDLEIRRSTALLETRRQMFRGF